MSPGPITVARGHKSKDQRLGQALAVELLVKQIVRLWPLNAAFIATNGRSRQLRRHCCLRRPLQGRDGKGVRNSTDAYFRPEK